VQYRYFGRWRVGALLMMVAAGCSAAALVFPWASAGTGSVTVMNAGEPAGRLALIFGLGASPWPERCWPGSAGRDGSASHGIPLGVASWLAWSAASSSSSPAGAPASEIRAGLGITLATTSGMASFAGGAAELFMGPDVVSEDVVEDAGSASRGERPPDTDEGDDEAPESDNADGELDAGDVDGEPDADDLGGLRPQPDAA